MAYQWPAGYLQFFTAAIMLGNMAGMHPVYGRSDD